MLFSLIEDVVAIDDLDRILTVDGIDCFMVVPGDLSQSMGPDYLGRPDHPDVQKVIADTMEVIVASGYSTGSTANDNNIAKWTNAGGRFFLCNYMGYVQNGLKELKAKSTSTD